MTVETKTTIQLSDIKAVEFECKNCHRVVSWPIQVVMKLPTECTCSTPQWMTIGGDMHQRLTSLIEQIRTLAKASGEPFVIRFAVEGVSGHVSSGKG
jgi:hypothetical protein